MENIPEKIYWQTQFGNYDVVYDSENKSWEFKIHYPVDYPIKDKFTFKGTGKLKKS